LSINVYATCNLLNCDLQINLKNLEKDSFWAKANEERLAKEEIFKGLMANFATKAPGWCQYSGYVIYSWSVATSYESTHNIY